MTTITREISDKCFIAPFHITGMENKWTRLVVTLKKDIYSTPSVQLQYLKDQTPPLEREEKEDGEEKKEIKKDKSYHYSLSGTHTSGFKPEMLRNNKAIDEDVDHTGMLIDVSITKKPTKVPGLIWGEREITVYYMEVTFANDETFEFRFDEQFYCHVIPMEICHNDIEELIEPITEDGDE